MNVTNEIRFTSVNATLEETRLFVAQQQSAIDSDSLSLLLFSVGGVSFGVNANQVAEITAYTGEVAEDLFWFHEEMSYGNRAVYYNNPVIVALKLHSAGVHKVIIDEMEDITEFRLDNLSIMPPLLEPFTLNSGYWGVLHRSGKMVLLLDYDLKLKGKAMFERHTSI